MTSDLLNVKPRCVDNLQNFKNWYLDVLEALYHNPHAGFAIMMITFPLLERYLRHKANMEPDDVQLGDDFHKELLAVFPALGDKATANSFWRVHRHGFLHENIFYAKYGRSATIRHDITEAIAVDTSSGEIVLFPKKFSQTVINTILADFATYEGTAAVYASLPAVQEVTTLTGGHNFMTISPSVGIAKSD